MTRTNKEKNRAQSIYRKDKDFGLLRKYKLIRKRCYSINCDHYKWYGAKGITVDWPSYIAFRKDMMPSYLLHLEKHGREDTTIDRIDSSKSYCKENCKWATKKEQHLTQSGRGRTKK